jgi:hypothetical protein
MSQKYPFRACVCLLRPFDVMEEAKSKDLAVLKLKKDLAKYGTAI